MKKNNFKFILPISVLSLALAFSLLYIMSNYKIEKPRPLNEEERIIKMHIDLLDNPKSPPDRVAMAMADLATKHRHERALEEAYKRVSDKNPDLRAASAKVFKVFPDNKALKAIKELIKDSDKEVSFEAIRSLAQDNKKKFEDELVELYFGREKLSSLQQVAVYVSLMESTRDMEYQERALAGLLNLAKHPTELYAEIARKELARRVWSHPKVMNLMKTFLLAGSDFNFSFIAIDKIIKHEKEWLDENLVKVFNSNGSRIATITRNRFYEFCPKNMWQGFKAAILKNDGKNRDFLIGTLTNMKHYDVASARKLLKNLKIPKGFNSASRKEILNFKKEIAKHKMKNPLCPHITL